MKRVLRYLLIGLAALSLLTAQPAKKSSTKDAPAAAAAAANKPLMDINSASEAELKTLPGIGDAYSAKIVKGRPYKRKDELVQRKIITQSTYNKIKDLIIAKQK
jgi:DNA uptake protein ComE-like DNA-binding protein